MVCYGNSDTVSIGWNFFLSASMNVMIWFFFLLWRWIWCSCSSCSLLLFCFYLLVVELVWVVQPYLLLLQATTMLFVVLDASWFRVVWSIWLASYLAPLHFLAGTCSICKFFFYSCLLPLFLCLLGCFFFFYSWVRLNTSNFKLVSSLTFVAYCHTRPCMACFCRELVIVFGFVYIMYISLCLSGVSTSFCMVWLYPIFFFFGSLFPFCLFFSLVHVYGIAGLPAWLLLIFIHIYILIKKN